MLGNRGQIAQSILTPEVNMVLSVDQLPEVSATMSARRPCTGINRVIGCIHILAAPTRGGGVSTNGKGSKRTTRRVTEESVARSPTCRLDLGFTCTTCPGPRIYLQVQISCRSSLPGSAHSKGWLISAASLRPTTLHNGGLRPLCFGCSTASRNTVMHYMACGRLYPACGSPKQCS